MTSERAEIRWIVTGVIGGLAASALYPLLLLLDLSPAATATAAGLLGPAIGIGSLGLRQLIELDRRSVTATLGAIHNVVAGALFTAMALVQVAVRSYAVEAAMSPRLVGVWLGLDVAWDVYIGLGTLFFACAMWRHPRFGWGFAVSGLALALAELLLNLYTYPVPPAEAGLFDIGPFVGLWYLGATIQAWRSLGWARSRLGRAAPDGG